VGRFLPTSCVAVVVGLTTIAAGETRAGVVLVLQSGSPTPVAGGFQYTYDASLNNDTQLQPGDYFSIIDFVGYVGGSVFSSNPNLIAASAVATTPPPLFQGYFDDPTIPNLLFTYIGPAVTTGPNSDLGDFGAVSIYGPSGLVVETASTHKQDTQNGLYDIVEGNTTRVRGPSIDTLGTPAPPGIVLAGLGAIGMIGFAACRRWAWA